MITFRQVNKWFGDLHVLNNVDFHVDAGEVVVICGPSGSGKSTLLNLVAGIDHVDGGRIIVEGVDITRLTETELARWRANSVGFIFQFYNLIPVLTAFENVELPLLLTRLSKSERRDHVETALRVVGLADRMDHFPSQLSGGQQQRVAIARSLANEPGILLCDEPTANLDHQTGDEILAILQRLNKERGGTTICATHDHRMMNICDRLMWIRDGGIERIARRDEVEVEVGHIE